MRFKLVYVIFLLLPVILVFKNLFLPGYLAWGDAPYFFPEGLKALIGEPLAWTNRGYSFGGINNLLWISPLMFFYGLVGGVLGNDFAIRVIFYIPSVIFSGVGVYFLTKYLKFSNIVTFISVLFYILNTYFILLIDGGQVGVALAYGLFPLTLLFLKKFVGTPSVRSFFPVLLFLTLCGVADPRIALISLLTIIVWEIFELRIKGLFYLVPLIFCWVGLNAYWLYPLFTNGIESFPLLNLQVGSLRWYDPLVLFSPNWPANLFGKISKPPIYFVFVPFLISGSVFLNGRRKIFSLVLSFLVFAFFIIYNPFKFLPFGFVFRDSTKFFIPLTLFGGILIGNTVNWLQSRFKFSIVIIYAFLLFLVSNALLGKMNFVLSDRQHAPDFQKIYENLRQDDSFYRSVWIPEKYPIAYETSDYPVVDGKDLVRLMPFAGMNGGEDVFNFLNNESFVDWFKILGLKYLILSGNPREISKTESEQKDWDAITNLIEKNERLEKIDLGTQVPVYKVQDTYSRFFAVKKLFAVVGESIGSTLPSVYFEDGKLDYKNLEGLDAKSVSLVFSGGDKTDLAMSFLQKYFLSPSENNFNQWVLYSKDDYLKYKYELLIRGIAFRDFDYGRGIAFSTKKGEKIGFGFRIPSSGKYVLAYRAMIPSSGEKLFRWHIVDENFDSSSKSGFDYSIENEGDLEIFNTIALIPKKDFDEAFSKADMFVKHFGVVDISLLGKEFESKGVRIENAWALKYRFIVPDGYSWILFSDNFNKGWQLKYNGGEVNSVPLYSSVNGFYVDSKWRGTEIGFKGQENVRWGMYFSTVSILVLAIIAIYLYERKNS